MAEAAGIVHRVGGHNGIARGEAELGDEVAWLSDEEQQAWRVMVAVHARLIARLDSDLQAGHAISLRDYEVLVQLSEADSASLRMAELAERLFVSPSGLTRRLDGLVRDGLVRRQACLSDRRGTLAVLSAEGWAALEEAAPTHVAGVRRYVFDPLDRKQLCQLTSSLRAMNSALGAPTHQPPTTPPGPVTPPGNPVRESTSTTPEEPTSLG